MSAACVGMAVAAVVSLDGRTMVVPVAPSALSTRTPAGLTGLTGAHPALVPGTPVTSEVDLVATSTGALDGVVLQVTPSGWSSQPSAAGSSVLTVTVRACSGTWTAVASSGASVCQGSIRQLASAVVGRAGGELPLPGLVGSAQGTTARLQVSLEVPPGAADGARPSSVHLAFVIRTSEA
ncbi:MAG: hypothetical protein ACP5P9_09510 [Acidimicrobiales bacterium]